MTHPCPKKIFFLLSFFLCTFQALIYGQDLHFENTYFGKRLPSVMCIDSSGNYYISGFRDTLFRSTDKGISWTKLNFILKNGTVEVSPDNRLFSYHSDPGYIYVSSDSGNTWSKFSDRRSFYDLAFGPDSAVYIFGGSSIELEIYKHDTLFTSIATVPGSSNAMFITRKNTIVSYGGNAIQISFDRGTQWQTQTLPIGISKVNGFLQVDNSTILIATDSGIFKTIDEGINWQYVSLSKQPVSGLKLDRIGRLFFCIPQKGSLPVGYYMSMDTARSWVEVFSSPLNTSKGYNTKESIVINQENDIFFFPKQWNCLVVLKNNNSIPKPWPDYPQVYSYYIANTSIASQYQLGLEVTQSGFVLAGFEGFGCRSDDSCVFWDQGGVGTASIFGKNEMISAGGGGSVGYSTDEGLSWKDIGFKSPDADITGHVVTRNRYIIASDGGKGSWLTKNWGTSWVRYDPSLTTSTEANLCQLKSGAVLSFGTRYLQRTTDYGKTWNGIATPIPSIQYYPILEVSPWGDIFILRVDSFIYRSTDEGKSWPWKTVHFQLHPRSITFRGDREVFVGTTEGVLLYSGDRGDNYIEISTNLPAYQIERLSVDSMGRMFVLLAEYGKEMFLYKTKLPSKLSVDSKSFKISDTPDLTVYPNPSNDFVTFSFELSKPSYLALSLYAISGNKLLSIMEGYQSDGKKDIPFNVSALPNGYYYSRLQVDDWVQTKPLIISH